MMCSVLTAVVSCHGRIWSESPTVCARVAVLCLHVVKMLIEEMGRERHA